MCNNFESFFNSVYKCKNIDIENSCLNRDRETIINDIYLKKLCEFIYKHDSLFGLNYSKVLIRYITSGIIRVCSLPEFLYKTRQQISESIYYSDIMNNCQSDIVPYFAKSSLTTFFADIVDKAVSCQNNGMPISIIDFNIMLHLYIMKTKKLKNNTSIWNGVDVSNCEDYSASTKVGFRIFRHQYNQQITNEIRGLLKMCLNCLSLSGMGLTNNSALGMLDIVALDKEQSRFRFDNINSVVEPKPSELYKHNIKILNMFEKRFTKPYWPLTLPKLQVYLCSSHSTDYMITKGIADYLKLPFSEIHKVLQHVSDWTNVYGIVNKIMPLIDDVKYTAGKGKKKRPINKMDIANIVYRALKKRDYGIVDRDLYNLCLKYYIPSMEFVVYNWNKDVFSPAISQVEIDYQQALNEVDSENINEFIRQLYVAGQSINLYRRLVVGRVDDTSLKVILKNVPLSSVSDINDILVEETKKLTTEYTDKFTFMITLDNKESLELARYKYDNDLNEFRDKYKKKYRRADSLDVNVYPSRKRVKRDKYRSISTDGGKKWHIDLHKQTTGKYKIVNELNKERVYYRDDYEEED